jgi:2-keto-4-pentenoate hydratase
MAQERMAQAAAYMWEERRRGAAYRNLPPALQPASVEEAYLGQDAFHLLAGPVHGAIAGWKIATTTRVMQELMGIPHPCAGAIFESRIHRSPAEVRAADHVSLKIECELAFRIAADLPARAEPFSAAAMLAAVDAVMPAFELVDDRHAVYRETSALSLIVDNAWNAGIVLGAPSDPAALPTLYGLAGSLQIADQAALEGRSDNPLQALAWIANLIAARSSGLKRGMVVMTGSLIPTRPIAAGEAAVFRVEGLGEVSLKAT